jgi:hypothetical protein
VMVIVVEIIPPMSVPRTLPADVKSTITHAANERTLLQFMVVSLSF